MATEPGIGINTSVKPDWTASDVSEPDGLAAKPSIVSPPATQSGTSYYGTCDRSSGERNFFGVNRASPFDERGRAPSDVIES